MYQNKGINNDKMGAYWKGEDVMPVLMLLIAFGSK
jgi:hypothetical protein